MSRVLLLAGTAEAVELSRRLADKGHDLTTSLAGATRSPAAYAGRVRRGGFGGAEGLAACLRTERIKVLIDATHPFAVRIAANAARAAGSAAVPRLKLLRPAWPVEPGWQEAGDLEAALDALPAGSHVLATTGSARAEALARRPDCRILLRAIEPPAVLPEGVRLLLARPPFIVQEERALMRAESITHLITRNAGGPARARLDAARAGAGPTVATFAEALDWLERLPTQPPAGHSA